MTQRASKLNVTDMSRMDMSAGGGRGRGPKKNYENTYRMEPKVKFSAQKAERIIREYMESELEGLKYDPTTAMSLAKSLSVEIKERVKETKYDRYRLVSVATVGTKHDADLFVASRCLMSPGIDTFATYTYENKDLFAVGTVYAIYRE